MVTLGCGGGVVGRGTLVQGLRHGDSGMWGGGVVGRGTLVQGLRHGDSGMGGGCGTGDSGTGTQAW